VPIAQMNRIIEAASDLDLAQSRLRSSWRETIEVVSLGFDQRYAPLPIPKNHSASHAQAAWADRVNLRKAIPEEYFTGDLDIHSGLSSTW